MAREIAASEPLAGITAGEIMPGEDVDDDERTRDWIRATTGTMFPPPGPARWAAPPTPCATPSCACGAWRACGWWTPR
jgi:hypothetical protein